MLKSITRKTTYSVDDILPGYDQIKYYPKYALDDLKKDIKEISNEEFIFLNDLGVLCGYANNSGHFRNLVKRNGFPTFLRINRESKNQFTLAVTVETAKEIIKKMKELGYFKSKPLDTKDLI